MLYESGIDNMPECRAVFCFGAFHLLHSFTTIQLHSHARMSVPCLHHELHVTRTDLEREYVKHNGVLVRVSRKDLQETGSFNDGMCAIVSRQRDSVENRTRSQTEEKCIEAGKLKWNEIRQWK